jgi:Zn-finger nucleic acid-binding protein
VIDLENSGLPCPRCGKVLEMGKHKEHKDFIIDYCAHCHGCWFDRGELARLLAVP